MKRTSSIFICFLFVCLLGNASTVSAAGFALYEWSNRGIAMGTTGYTFYGDASVVATNPALMTQHEGGEMLVGVAAIAPSSDVVVAGSEQKTKDKTHLVPHAYYTQQVEDDVWLGIGMFTRFGLGTRYKDGWPGAAELQYVNLKASSVNPTIAFKFSEDFSAAVGVELLKGGMQLERSAMTANTNGWGVGGNIGLNYMLSDEWSTALTYRAPIKFFSSGTGAVKVGAASFHTEEFEIAATLPDSLTFGLGYKPMENWSLEFDTIFTHWELTNKMTFSNVPLLGTIEDKLDYKNSWRFQLGTEYWATDWLALRAGYIYDVTPTVGYEASYMLPVNDRQLYSTGLGFKIADFKIDWSFMYVTTKGRTGLTIGGNPVEFKNGKTWISGLSVGYEW